MSVKKFLKDKGVEEKIIMAGIFSSSNLTMSAIMLASVAIDFAGDLIGDLMLSKQRKELADTKARVAKINSKLEALKKISHIIKKVNDIDEFISLKEAKSLQKDISFCIKHLDEDKYKRLVDQFKPMNKDLKEKIKKFKAPKIKV